jgi:hypothetical protein
MHDQYSGGVRTWWNILGYDWQRLRGATFRLKVLFPKDWINATGQASATGDPHWIEMSRRLLWLGK